MAKTAFSALRLGIALMLLDTRSLAAGVLIGLLAYKPQFGLLIPLVLVVTGRWLVIAAAGATVLAACAVTLALFGRKVWIAFAASTSLTRHIILEVGATGWEKIQSLFSAVRMWGGSIDAACAAQGAPALVVAAGLIWLWRSNAAYELKAAALASGALIATPHVLDYDLMMLAAAIAFYVRHSLDRIPQLRNFAAGHCLGWKAKRVQKCWSIATATCSTACVYFPSNKIKSKLTTKARAANTRNSMASFLDAPFNFLLLLSVKVSAIDARAINFRLSKFVAEPFAMHSASCAARYRGPPSPQSAFRRTQPRRANLARPARIRASIPGCPIQI